MNHTDFLFIEELQAITKEQQGSLNSALTGGSNSMRQYHKTADKLEIKFNGVVLATTEQITTKIGGGTLDRMLIFEPLGKIAKCRNILDEIEPIIPRIQTQMIKLWQNIIPKLCEKIPEKAGNRFTKFWGVIELIATELDGEQGKENVEKLIKKFERKRTEFASEQDYIGGAIAELVENESIFIQTSLNLSYNAKSSTAILSLMKELNDFRLGCVP